MKDIIINDVHFGYRQNAKWHFESLKRFFTHQLLPYIKENDDIVSLWMLGDWFESRNSGTFNRITESIEILEQISEALPENGKIYMLVGNHDLFYKNDMEQHNFAPYKHIPKVEILLGNGYIDIPNTDKKVFYHSYNHTDVIYDTLTSNKVTADVFFGHVETDGSKIISYIKNNFKYGYSGHVHNLEPHDNFYWLPSTQQNKTDEVDSVHGFSVIDWDICEIEMVDNVVSGRFKTIKFGDEIKSEDIKNNFIKLFIDKSKVKKLSSRKLQQDMIMNEFRETIDKHEPAIVLDIEYVDSEKEIASEKMLSESDKLLREKDLIGSTSSIDDDILVVIAESEIEFAEETMLEAKEFMDSRGK